MLLLLLESIYIFQIYLLKYFQLIFSTWEKNGQIKFYKLGDFYTLNKQHGPIAH